jgi:predicted nucleotide-binding protein
MSKKKRLIGRDRVVGLVKPGLEIPTDFQGVSYIEIDSAGAWRLLLAREIKAVGIDINLNDAIKSTAI